MTTKEIRDEVMQADFTDLRALMDVLEHIANKLCDFEYELQYLNEQKQNRPYDPKERC